MLIDPPENFARIYERHGHRCPMSTLGGRLGLAAMKALGVSIGDELRAAYGSKTCALDGIAETTGCDESSGTLKILSEGRHSLILKTVQASVEVELTEKALDMAGRYRSLCNRLEKNWDALDAEEQGRRRAEMDAMLDELLPQFWQMEDDLLVKCL